MTIKVNINRQQGILHLPNDFAILEKISSKGYYHYTVRYSADVVRAIQNNSIKLKIIVSNKQYSQKSPNLLTQVDSTKMINNLLLGAALKRDSSKIAEANPKTIQNDPRVIAAYLGED